MDWLKRRRKTAPELPLEAPLPLCNHSNGEMFHTATALERRAQALILRLADERARRLGLPRREFLASALGMATSLSVINLIHGCGSSESGGNAGSGGSSGDGGYLVPDAATEDGDLACQLLDTSADFIFDVQTHHVNPAGTWRQTNPSWESFFSLLPQGSCGEGAVECFSARNYIEQMFINSATTVAVLSGVPAVLCTSGQTSGCGSPLDNNEIAETRELVNALAQGVRSVNHCMVTPNTNLSEQLALMEQVHAERTVAAWKCYTPWGPSGAGFWLDDPVVGIPFIEKGRALGVKIFCCHKGLPLPSFDPTHTDPKDIAVVAKMFPDTAFVVYHSAYGHGAPAGFGGWPTEGPYDPSGAVDPQNPTTYPVDRGVNSLVHALVSAGIGPGQNVYAELGSTWRDLMTSPVEAAHVLGKLLLHVGEDNILWGTDSIWYGSPQPQIEAFKLFSISSELQQSYGYPALTPAIKAKIFGLNAAKLYGVDPLAMRCAIEKSALAQAKLQLDAELGPRRWAFQKPAGPRTRRELLALWRATRGQPG